MIWSSAGIGRRARDAVDTGSTVKRRVSSRKEIRGGSSGLGVVLSMPPSLHAGEGQERRRAFRLRAREEDCARDGRTKLTPDRASTKSPKIDTRHGFFRNERTAPTEEE